MAIIGSTTTAPDMVAVVVYDLDFEKSNATRQSRTGRTERATRAPGELYV